MSPKSITTRGLGLQGNGVGAKVLLDVPIVFEDVVKLMLADQTSDIGINNLTGYKSRISNAIPITERVLDMPDRGFPGNKNNIAPTALISRNQRTPKNVFFLCLVENLM